MVTASPVIVARRSFVRPTATSAPKPSGVLKGITWALDGPPDVVREQLRILLDGQRLHVFQNADGSVVVRGALDLGVVLGAKTTNATAVSSGRATVHCGGGILQTGSRLPIPFSGLRAA